MNHSGEAKFSKYFLIVVNVIFLIMGAWAIGVAVYTVSIYPYSIAILLVPSLVGGSISLIASVLGCIGAYKENPKLLKIYGGIMVGYLAFKLVILSINLLQTDDQAVSFPSLSDMKKAFDSYGRDANITESVHQMQAKLFCCGLYEPKSMILPNGTYPSSCCIYEGRACRDPFSNGCFSRATRTTSPLQLVRSIVFAVMLVLHILLIIAAFYFASKIQRKMNTQQLQSLHTHM